MNVAPAPNPKISSIEHVGDDGFIVESVDLADPEFVGGKRLFKDFDTLLRFLSKYLYVRKQEGSTYGMREKEHGVRTGRAGDLSPQEKQSEDR